MSPKEKLPLSPMLVQYLAGLCVLKWGAAASVKEVVLGDMVLDQASGEPRDVDVTVTLDTPDGEYAFMGYEVKHWKKPLNESHVEQLAAKLNDMPGVTHRAIVSTSGYYKPAIKKAAYHGVDLYVIKESTTPLEEHFPDLAPMTGKPSEVIRAAQWLLTWKEWDIWLDVHAPDFNIAPEDPIFDERGRVHSAYPNFGAFGYEMLVRSTDILCLTKPLKDRVEPLDDAYRRGEPIPDEPPWSFGHTLGVMGDEAYIRLSDENLHQVRGVTIVGKLRWEFHPWLYCAMEKVPTGEMFSGAVVATSPIPGRMAAIVIPTQGREWDVRQVRLKPDHRNSIRDLRIPAAEDNPSAG
ncbi:restriction endonuclease [Mycobacterium avium subsp. paratuberculosis]|uniref:restriction endonuclease n=1 Tax=Mycobacterium avium TaxID=1764 RepID=UPI001130D53A|nr:restriction endonuclease [Mycobacterium avium]QQK50781.1 restriction endonuclease [Mycobacterium avium subsp. paratuberculosis]WAI52976.1 restriction endonuclease [Mycobacterium avium subsp. paratuberculosis]